MKTTVGALFLLAVSGGPLHAIGLTQYAGAAHAYPAMLDLNGKRVATGEFTQEIEGHLLRIQITYDRINGGRIEEKATFQQRAGLIQQKSSWRELRDETLQREYTVDFDSGRAATRKRKKDGFKEWSEQVKIEQGRSFAGFGFTLALQNLRDRLGKGETIGLQAVGFTPKPRVVTVKLSYDGVDRIHMSSRS